MEYQLWDINYLHFVSRLLLSGCFHRDGQVKHADYSKVFAAWTRRNLAKVGPEWAYGKTRDLMGKFGENTVIQNMI